MWFFARLVGEVNDRRKIGRPHPCSLHSLCSQTKRVAWWRVPPVAERGAIVLLHVARKRQIGEPRDMHAVQLLVDDGWGRRRRLGEGGKFLLGYCFLVKGKVVWLCTCRRHGFCGCVWMRWARGWWVAVGGK